jgi:hypothetical protein
MRWTATLFLLACALPARAEYVAWKYNWSRSPTQVYSDNSTTSYVKLTDEPLTYVTGDSDIVATNLKVVSDASPDSPATFTNKPYTLTLFLLDVDSGESGSLPFAGVLNGTVSALNSKLGNQFVGSPTQELDLGTHHYTVTIGPYTPPGPPESSNPGAIAAFATVQVTEIQKTPEPSTLALALIGLPVLGFRVYRRRRIQVAG